jgi:hypothetical protein
MCCVERTPQEQHHKHTTTTDKPTQSTHVTTNSSVYLRRGRGWRSTRGSAPGCCRGSRRPGYRLWSAAPSPAAIEGKCECVSTGRYTAINVDSETCRGLGCRLESSHHKADPTHKHAQAKAWQTPNKAGPSDTVEKHPVRDQTPAARQSTRQTTKQQTTRHARASHTAQSSV